MDKFIAGARSMLHDMDPAFMLFVLVLIGIWMEVTGHGADLRKDATNGLFITLQVRPKGGA